MDAKDPLAAEVSAFWSRGDPRDRRWFEKNPEFDAEIRRRFLALYENAAAGKLDSWLDAPEEALALVIVLDQFPRNMFRGSARAFAADPVALRCAKLALEHGHDRGMRPSERLFLYLPYEHAESLAEQERACELTRPLAQFPETHDVYRYALAHRDIIARFGRFPHRNAILGRASTPEELEFLQQPGSGF